MTFLIKSQTEHQEKKSMSIEKLFLDIWNIMKCKDIPY